MVLTHMYTTKETIKQISDINVVDEILMKWNCHLLCEYWRPKDGIFWVWYDCNVTFYDHSILPLFFYTLDCD